MTLESFIVYIKVDGTYKDIVEDIETRFETRLQIMNQINQCLKEKKKVAGLMKDELDRKIVAKFVGLEAKS